MKITFIELFCAKNFMKQVLYVHYPFELLNYPKRSIMMMIPITEDESSGKLTNCVTSHRE